MPEIIRLYRKLYSPADAPSIAPATSAPPPMFTPGVSPGTLSGVGTVFNVNSHDLGGYRLRILPGAFNASIKKGTVFACWMHNADEMFGSTKNRTMRLRDDGKRLLVEIDVAPTGRGFDAYTLVSGGYLGEMSVGLSVEGVKFVNEKQSDGTIITVEEVSKAKLWEISVVTAGAMPGTSVAAAGSAGLTRQSAPLGDLARLRKSIDQAQALTGVMTRAQIIASTNAIAARFKTSLTN